MARPRAGRALAGLGGLPRHRDRRSRTARLAARVPISTGAATAVGALVSLSAGIATALTSGATADLVETGADVIGQQAVIQGAWIVLHGAWYAATLLVFAWLVPFAPTAHRRRVLGTTGLVLLLVVAASVPAIPVVSVYPVNLPVVSLAFVVLGVVLLRRARRAARPPVPGRADGVGAPASAPAGA